MLIFARFLDMFLIWHALLSPTPHSTPHSSLHLSLPLSVPPSRSHTLNGCVQLKLHRDIALFVYCATSLHLSLALSPSFRHIQVPRTRSIRPDVESPLAKPNKGDHRQSSSSSSSLKLISWVSQHFFIVVLSLFVALSALILCRFVLALMVLFVYLVLNLRANKVHKSVVDWINL